MALGHLADLGRLCPGAKADLVIVNQRALHYGAVCDPILAWSIAASPAMLRRSSWMVKVVMDNRHISAAPALDALLARAQRVCGSLLVHIPQLSWDGRTAARPSRMLSHGWKGLCNAATAGKCSHYHLYRPRFLAGHSASTHRGAAPESRHPHSIRNGRPGWIRCWHDGKGAHRITGVRG